MPGLDGSFEDGDAVIKMAIKRKFSIIPGSVRKWSEAMGRHSLAEREDAEMCTPMCAKVIDVLACGKLTPLAPEFAITIYSVPSNDIDQNIRALREAINYLEWLKIGEQA